MLKAIYSKILGREVSSVEIKSSLGRELYIWNGDYWTCGSIEYTDEIICLYIRDYVAWAVENNKNLVILIGKAEFRQAINSAKELLTEWLEYSDISDFMSLYHTLPAKQKEAVLLVLRHSEIRDSELFCPSTSELSLLWKSSVKKQKRKANLLVPVIGEDYECTINLFTGEIVDYVDMDVIEGNF